MKAIVWYTCILRFDGRNFYADEIEVMVAVLLSAGTELIAQPKQPIDLHWKEGRHQTASAANYSKR